MMLCVIERDNRIYNPDARDRYIGGSPCVSYDGARELVCAHCEYGHDISVSYVEDGTDYNEIDRETGEVVKEYFVRQLNWIPKI